MQIKTFICNMLLLLSIIGCMLEAHSNKSKVKYNVDLVVFSQDNPIQLYSCLESIKKYASAVGDICVIYEVSGPLFDMAYQKIKDEFPDVNFFKHNLASRTSKFTPLFLRLLVETLIRKHVALVADSITVRDSIDFQRCCDLMRHENAHAFSLLNRKHVSNSLNMTIYKRLDLIKLFKNMQIDSLVKLEFELNKSMIDKRVLFSEPSKVINLVLDKEFSKSKLLNIFNADFKIDIRFFMNFVLRANYSPIWDKLIDFVPAESKHIVVVIASYNNEKWYKLNLDSVLMQKYKNFHVIYIDDKSSDKTASLVEAYVNKNKLSDKILLIKNKERSGAMANLYNAINSCNPNDIIVILDGDDWFSTDHALELINKVYNRYDVLLTYGDYVYYPEKMKSICSEFPKDVVESRAFRDHKFITSHLRTFYAGLFQKIKVDDLKYNGFFFGMACDVATMIPMLEMCGDRFMFIQDVMCVHNRDNPINDNKVDINYLFELHRYIKTLPKYPKLDVLS